MGKDSFLDSNVIINYANYEKKGSKEIVVKCYDYIVNKEDKFIVCYAVVKELYHIITKLTIMHRQVLKKIEDENYHLNEGNVLSNRDIPIVEKLYLAHKEIKREKLIALFASQRDIFEIEIERFLKNKADIKVIPLSEINIDLVNALRDIISNYADCQIVASALQHQRERDLFLFVTADKRDLNPNDYQYAQEYGVLKNYQFPELLNLMFTA